MLKIIFLPTWHFLDSPFSRSINMQDIEEAEQERLKRKRRKKRHHKRKKRKEKKEDDKFMDIMV